LKEAKFLAQTVSSYLSRSINKVVLAGEREELADLAKEIGSKLTVPVLVANPFCNMEISPDVDFAMLCKVSPVMLVSCGLALRVGGV
jgi:type IV pilus assembly protein PilM